MKPLDSEHDDWTGDPDEDRAFLVARMHAAGPRPIPRSTHKPSDDLRDMLGVVAALTVLLAALLILAAVL